MAQGIDGEGCVINLTQDITDEDDDLQADDTDDGRYLDYKHGDGCDDDGEGDDKEGDDKEGDDNKGDDKEDGGSSEGNENEGSGEDNDGNAGNEDDGVNLTRAQNELDKPTKILNDHPHIMNDSPNLLSVLNRINSHNTVVLHHCASLSTTRQYINTLSTTMATFKRKLEVKEDEHEKRRRIMTFMQEDYSQFMTTACLDEFKTHGDTIERLRERCASLDVDIKTSRAVLCAKRFFGHEGFMVIDWSSIFGKKPLLSVISELDNYMGIFNQYPPQGNNDEVPEEVPEEQRFQHVMDRSKYPQVVTDLIEKLREFMVKKGTPEVSITEVSALMSLNGCQDQLWHTDGTTPDEVYNGSLLWSVMTQTHIDVVPGSQVLYGLSQEEQLKLVKTHNLQIRRLELKRGTGILFCGGLIHRGTENLYKGNHYRIHAYVDFFNRRHDRTRFVDDSIITAIEDNN